MPTPAEIVVNHYELPYSTPEYIEHYFQIRFAKIAQVHADGSLTLDGLHFQLGNENKLKSYLKGKKGLDAGSQILDTYPEIHEVIRKLKDRYQILRSARQCGNFQHFLSHLKVNINMLETIAQSIQNTGFLHWQVIKELDKDSKETAEQGLPHSAYRI